MKKQVMTLTDNGRHFLCIYDDAAKKHPYGLYEKWYDGGWHRKKIAKSDDLASILAYMLENRLVKVQWR